MKKVIPVLTLFLLTSICSYGQKKQTVSELYTIAPISLITPLLIDSTTIKGDKFSEKELLKMNLSFPEQAAFVRPLKADTAGYLFPGNKPEENSVFQLFSFNISSDRYAKGTLKVISPNMFEIYVDGKLSASKTTKEDNLRAEKDASTTIAPYPMTCRVVVKMLCSAKDIAAPALKIVLENAKGDSLTNFKVFHNEKRFANFTDVMLGKRVSFTSVSPDGSYVLIGYRNTFGEKSLSSTELYNVKTGGSVLIDTDNTKKQLNWMPRSNQLYYVRKTDVGTALILVDPSTLSEKVLSKNIPDERISFSPDEKVLFYSKTEKAEEKKSDFKLFLSPEDRQPGYKDRSFIYKYDLSTGLSQQLTFGSHSTWLNDISSDSRQLLISMTDETLTERPFRKSTMLLLDLVTMKADTIWKNEGFAYSAQFSPDGKKIVVSGAGEAFGGIGLNLNEGQIANSYNRLAFVMDLNDKKIEPITKNFDPSIDEIYWSKKDNQLYFRTTERDLVTVYAYNLGAKQFNKLPLQEDVVRSFSLSAHGDMAAYMGVGQSNSTKAYLFDLRSQKSTLIADPYAERMAQIELGKAKEWNFTNSDGVEIAGSCILPPNFNPQKKYPMIVYYYGGTMPSPRTFEGPYPAHIFAAQGYVVYVVQPSGTTGFGQKFAALHVNAWGKRTAEDIIEGTKQFLKEHPYVDDTKIGCIGASYGGFMTMYLQTQTDMFAAAVSHAGISSISSYWGEGYWGYTYSSGASAHSYPWNNPELYVKQSPLFSADKIKTPILLTHGAVDTNVPIGESIQMYTALKVLGKPVEFLQVKDENHGIINYKRRIEWNNSIMAWFSKWLRNDDAWWRDLYPDSK